MGQGSSPVEARELRILVLHNHDFGRGAPEEVADRVDVLNAAQHVARALAARGHFVEVQAADADDLGRLLAQLREDRPDLVFNLCESLAGDARNEVVVPALLDMLRIPYTGSGPLGLGLALHKDRAKQLLRSAGVPTPAWVALPAAGTDDGDLRLLEAAGLTFPLMVKPAREDASVGISAASVVADEESLRAQVARLREQHRQPVLCERYVAGREIYVSLLGNGPPRALPLTEIDFSRLPPGRPPIVCYEAKWRPGSAAFAGTRSGPARPLPAAVAAEIVTVAQRAAAVLGLRDYGRCDVRLDGDGTPYVIDVNPNCDLSDGAGFSLAAREAGLGYDQMIEQIAAEALRRSDHDPQGALFYDPALAAAGPGGAARARGEGRAVLGGRGELRARAHRQRTV